MLGVAIPLCSARAADTCDRACLEGFVDQYLAALVAQDPSKLPLAKNARYTENGQELKLGDGMWGPTVTLGTYKLYFTDPQAGQVGFFGTIEEHGHPVILGLRLKIAREAGTDKNTPFDKDRQRIENGQITSNDPTSKSEITRMSCGAQFATRFTKVITRVQERGFPVVDEERGMVLSIAWTARSIGSRRW